MPDILGRTESMPCTSRWTETKFAVERVERDGDKTDGRTSNGRERDGRGQVYFIVYMAFGDVKEEGGDSCLHLIL